MKNRRGKLIILISIPVLLGVAFFILSKEKAKRYEYSSLYDIGRIEFNSPCVVINTKGEQFLSEMPEGQDFIGSRPELLGYTNVGMDELSLITIVDSLCYYRFNRNGPKQFVVGLEDRNGLPGIIDKNGFDGWDASFDLKLIPFTEIRRDRSMSFMKWMSFLVWTKWALPHFTDNIPDTYALSGLNLNPGLIRMGYYTIAVNDVEYLVYNAYSDYLKEGIRIIADTPFETEETNIHIQNYTVRRITNPEEYTFELKLDRTESGLFKAVLVGIKKRGGRPAGHSPL